VNNRRKRANAWIGGLRQKCLRIARKLVAFVRGAKRAAVLIEKQTVGKD